MKRHLVAADADQIQHLLFRSSHLREVIGGSMLLSQFCKDGTNAALAKIGASSKADVIINDGGSFRLEFDSPDKAREFLEYLADSFRKETGGTLTVAGPIEYEDDESQTNNKEDGFKAKNEKLQLDLLNAKYCREGAEAEPQLPISAFCTSCGTELATDYATPTPELPKEERIQTYLCSNCQNKTKERQEQKHPFFNRYREAIQQWEKKLNRKTEYPFENPMDPAELIGSLDATQYVGYVLADANGMGRYFNKCKSKDDLAKLSDDLTNALWTSLAEPIPDLIERLIKRDKLKNLKNRMPIVPLILGGDDLLALVPARYALDIGRRIGKAFEDEKEMNKLGVTLGVAVIICQNHYPYTLAYERGHELLKQAKKLGKSLKSCKLSALNFEVIIGNELKASRADQAAKKNEIRSTLKPYWIGSKAEPNSLEVSNAGIHLDTFLEQRKNLKSIPKKRLHELRRFFDQEQANKPRDAAQWTKDFYEFRQRVKPENWADALNKTLAVLGVDSNNNWRSVLRRPKEDPYSASGMLDLIEAWDYAFQLHIEDKEYRVEES